MDLEAGDDQLMFWETTRKFLSVEMPTTRVRELATLGQAHPEGWWTEGAQLGWTSLLVPEDHGGGHVGPSGVGDAVGVASEFGRAVAPGPLLPCTVAAAALAGSAQPHGDTLARIASGELVAAWHPGPVGPSGRSGHDLAAESTPVGYRLTGRSAPVEAASSADVLVLAAADGDGVGQVVVDRDHPGVIVEALGSIDLVRQYGAVHMDGVEVPWAAVVHDGPGAHDAVELQLGLANLLQAAEMVGAAEVVLDFTLDYVRNRYTFGRPLGSYQEIKHRFADMKTWVEASFAITAAAAQAFDRGDGALAVRRATAAKAYAGDRLPELAQDCLQIHGGIGVTADHDLHLFLRRITQDSVLFGDPRAQRRRLATWRCSEVLA